MDVKLCIVIELLILYSLVYFMGFLKERLIFYKKKCATKVVWTCIHAYGGEWVKDKLVVASSSDMCTCTQSHEAHNHIIT